MPAGLNTVPSRGSVAFPHVAQLIPVDPNLTNVAYTAVTEPAAVAVQLVGFVSALVQVTPPFHCQKSNSQFAEGEGSVDVAVKLSAQFALCPSVSVAPHAVIFPGVVVP